MKIYDTERDVMDKNCFGHECPDFEVEELKKYGDKKWNLK